MSELTIKLAFFYIFARRQKATRASFCLHIMGKIIYNRFDKHDIQGLPRAVFEGRIIVINTSADAEKAVSYLLSQNILGIDTETRPSFKKGAHMRLLSYRCPHTTHASSLGSTLQD